MSKPPKNKGGRPPHDPPEGKRTEVAALASFGIKEEDIARYIGVAIMTLRKHYAEELFRGRISANAKVAQSLYKNATTRGPGQTTAQIFWLKTRAGWKEPPREVSGPGGAPITTVDLSKATPEQLNALEAIFGPLAGGSGDDDGGAPGGEGEESA
ncbi:hypothetical protein [Methylobacterium nodulans]|uniref:Uncharacterized protein n=1 Tax=Methylobacterium nodulans (strain LMG 21967 / CNCM I-2342 / ORS 2060) TaxID=460265 RepID=B8IIU3_METNO|nr:hypothetical protein [Methylobacterium nodulans]ACL61738.1 hypothetical protein Mnod_6996 [Methylobacterium nodulans ORS 2060]